MSGPVETQRVSGQGGRGGLALATSAACLVAFLAAWGAVAGPPAPGPDASSSRASPSPLSSPSPTSPRDAAPGIPFVRGSADGLDLAADHLGWAPCPAWNGHLRRGRARPAEVVAAAGWLPREGTTAILADAQGRPARVWIGRVFAEAAAAWEATVAFEGGDGARWIVTRRGEVLRLAASEAASGIAYWQVVDEAGPMPWCDAARGVGPGPATRAPEVVEGAGSGPVLVASRGGWDGCAWARYSVVSMPDGDRIDAVAEADGIAEGWVEPDGTALVWIGRDPADLGRALGARVVALGEADEGTAWVLLDVRGAPYGQQVRRIDTPAGRVAWLPTANATGPTCLISPWFPGP